MGNDNRDRGSVKKSDSSNAGDNKKVTPGKQQEGQGSNSESKQGKGNRPNEEYPSQGSHFPSDPSTGPKKGSKGSSSDEESDDQDPE
jgi:hypothetical protein